MQPRTKRGEMQRKAKQSKAERQKSEMQLKSKAKQKTTNAL
jgi:hypothetical protein